LRLRADGENAAAGCEAVSCGPLWKIAGSLANDRLLIEVGAIGWATGQQKSFISRENVVIVTTLVHLSGQLSNLRHELRSLFDAL